MGRFDFISMGIKKIQIQKFSAATFEILETFIIDRKPRASKHFIGIQSSQSATEIGTANQSDDRAFKEKLSAKDELAGQMFEDELELAYAVINGVEARGKKGNYSTKRIKLRADRPT